MVRVYVIKQNCEVKGVATNRRKAIEFVESLLNQPDLALKDYGKEAGIAEETDGTKVEFIRFEAY